MRVNRFHLENARSSLPSYDRLPDQPGFSCSSGDRKKTIMRVSSHSGLLYREWKINRAAYVVIIVGLLAFPLLGSIARAVNSAQLSQYSPVDRLTATVWYFAWSLLAYPVHRALFLLAFLVGALCGWWTVLTERREWTLESALVGPVTVSDVLVAKTRMAIISITVAALLGSLVLTGESLVYAPRWIAVAEGLRWLVLTGGTAFAAYAAALLFSLLAGEAAVAAAWVVLAFSLPMVLYEFAMALITQTAGYPSTVAAMAVVNRIHMAAQIFMLYDYGSGMTGFSSTGPNLLYLNEASITWILLGWIALGVLLFGLALRFARGMPLERFRKAFVAPVLGTVTFAGLIAAVSSLFGLLAAHFDPGDRGWSFLLIFVVATAAAATGLTALLRRVRRRRDARNAQ